MDGRGEPAWRQAEFAAEHWMREWGFRDAKVTRGSRDGGIDVLSRRAAAQVKHQAKAVGEIPIRELRGAAHDHEHALFFSWSTYTTGAIRFADDKRVALFQVVSSGPVPVNTVAQRFMRDVASQARAARRAAKKQEQARRRSEKAAERAAAAEQKRGEAQAKHEAEQAQAEDARVRATRARAGEAGTAHQSSPPQPDQAAPRQADDAERLHREHEWAAEEAARHQAEARAAAEAQRRRADVEARQRKQDRRAMTRARYGHSDDAGPLAFGSIVLGVIGFLCPFLVLAAIGWGMALASRRHLTEAGVGASPPAVRVAGWVSGASLSFSTLVVLAAFGAAFAPSGATTVSGVVIVVGVVLLPPVVAGVCALWWHRVSAGRAGRTE